MSKLGIVVPVLWHEGFTDLMLSIKTKHEYKVYVEPQYIFKKVLSQAWNHGMDRAFADGCDYALVCNDDILFAPCAIDALVECYKQERPNNVLMVTANNIMGELGGDKYKALTYDFPQNTTFSVADHPNFSCFMVAKEYIEKVGYFDEGFNPAWYEDNDSHRRAVLAGYREIVTTSAPTAHVHMGATSLLAQTNPAAINSDLSRVHYIEKWGGLPGGEIYATPHNDPTKTVRDW